MDTELRAISISRGVIDMLRDAPFRGRVVGVFTHACTLASADGRVIGVVGTDAGDGPLNVVLDAKDVEAIVVLDGVQAGTPATMHEAGLWIGPVHITLQEARVWEPLPEWGELRARAGQIVRHLPALQAVAVAAAPTGSLLTLLDDKPEAARGGQDLGAGDTFAARVYRAGQALRAGWAGDADLREAAAGLAGLGGGLTPAGDDFLAGVMLWAWLAHPDAERWCSRLAKAAAPRTTTLAAALLRAAARGECSHAWQALLNALAAGGPERLATAVRDVLAYGSTSGGDMLAGFLWLRGGESASL
jgi:hypothetical protein